MAYIKRSRTAPKGPNQRLATEHSSGSISNREKAEKILKEYKASQSHIPTKLVQIDSKTWKEAKIYDTEEPD